MRLLPFLFVLLVLGRAYAVLPNIVRDTIPATGYPYTSAKAAETACLNAGYEKLCSKNDVISVGGNACSAGYTSDAGRGWWVGKGMERGNGCGTEGWNAWIPDDVDGSAHCCKKSTRLFYYQQYECGELMSTFFPDQSWLYTVLLHNGMYAGMRRCVGMPAKDPERTTILNWAQKADPFITVTTSVNVPEFPTNRPCIASIPQGIGVTLDDVFRYSDFACSHYARDVANDISELRPEGQAIWNNVQDADLDDKDIVLSVNFKCFDTTETSVAIQNSATHTVSVTSLALGASVSRAINPCDSRADPHPVTPHNNRLPDSSSDGGFDPSNPGDWTVLVLTLLFIAAVWVDLSVNNQLDRIYT